MTPSGVLAESNNLIGAPIKFKKILNTSYDTNQSKVMKVAQTVQVVLLRSRIF